MRGNRVAAALLLVVAASGCIGGKKDFKPRFSAPAGSAVWFADGFAGREAQDEAEAALARGDFSWVLLSAARIEWRDGAW